MTPDDPSAATEGRDASGASSSLPTEVQDGKIKFDSRSIELILSVLPAIVTECAEPWEKLTQDMKNDRVLYMRAADIVVRIATSPACTRRSHLHPPGRTCTRRPHLHPPATAHRHAQDCVVDICGLLGDQSPFAVVVGGKPIREAWNDSLDRSVLKCLSRPGMPLAAFTWFNADKHVRHVDGKQSLRVSKCAASPLASNALVLVTRSRRRLSHACRPRAAGLTHGVWLTATSPSSWRRSTARPSGARSGCSRSSGMVRFPSHGRGRRWWTRSLDRSTLSSSKSLPTPTR